jgi:thiocyanate hydrolase subunit gamma
MAYERDEHSGVQVSSKVSEFEILELAIRELSIEHGLFSADDHRRYKEWAENIGLAAGARMVAKAWLDPAFKQRLLADGAKASEEVGVNWLDPTGSGSASDYTYFYVLENTPEVHNVIVCTLCSCYPRPVLG